MSWQPIETAPRDGTEVIVFDQSESPFIFTACCFGPYDEFYGWDKSSRNVSAMKDRFFGDEPIFPTHWMPLPDPPINMDESK